MVPRVSTENTCVIAARAEYAVRWVETVSWLYIVDRPTDSRGGVDRKRVVRVTCVARFADLRRRCAGQTFVKGKLQLEGQA